MLGGVLPFRYVPAVRTLPSEVEQHLSALPAAVGEYFRHHAVEQPGSDVPPGWRRRRNRSPHGCYAAAGRWHGHDRAIYTEGYASGAAGFWVPHAWLTAAEGGVIDLAWPDPGSRYVGCQIESQEAAKAILTLDAYGPLLPTVVGAS
jgi:hypothetical protein